MIYLNTSIPNNGLNCNNLSIITRSIWIIQKTLIPLPRISLSVNITLLKIMPCILTVLKRKITNSILSCNKSLMLKTKVKSTNYITFFIIIFSLESLTENMLLLLIINFFQSDWKSLKSWMFSHFLCSKYSFLKLIIYLILTWSWNLLIYKMSVIFFSNYPK